MTRRRKHSNLHYAQRILTLVWRHPNNRRRRVRSMLRAVGWQVQRRAGRHRDVTVYGGYTLRCYPDSGSASNVIYFGDLYDVVEMGFLRRYLRRGDAVIDGGANIGTYSLLAAALVGPDGRVDAFEPVPNACRRLRENVSRNRLDGVVHVHEAAIGADNATVAMQSEWDVSNRTATPDEVGAAGLIEVSTVRLDDALPDGVQYSVAKLDVEGAERAAIRGAARHLAEGNPPVLLLEATNSQLRRFGSSQAEVAEELQRLGYERWEYDETTSGLAPVEREAWRGNALFVATRARSTVLARLAEELALS
jgi:FkbM family methyltransferase